MIKKIKNTFNFFLLVCSTSIFSQSLPDSTNLIQFSELSANSFQGVWLGATAFGDYNNDDNIDMLITGLTKDYEIVTKLYQNNGEGLFIEQSSISLTGVYLSTVSWGDYDNDGDLDLLLTGNTSIYSALPITKVYKNNDGIYFSEQTALSLAGVYQGAAAWGDYNNDGLLDILLTGQSVSGPISKVYQNDGSNGFIEQTQISLVGVKNSTAHFIDYNNDSQLDIFITGSTGQSRTSKLYRNNGNNSFTEQTSILFQGIESGSSAWGDYDSDGDLDLLLTGLSVNGAVSKVYRNNGSSSFTEQTSISLQGVLYGSTSWCDLDNDGMLDIFLTGATNSNPISALKIYRNNNYGSFSLANTANLATSFFSSHACADIDNDSDLDLFLSGNHGDTIIAKIYKNEGIFYNSAPDPPTNLSASFNGNDITFKWDRSTDTETPHKGLSYNLVIGAASNSGNRLTAMSNRENGFRKIVSLGNVNHDTIWTVKNLPKGIYYWSVQSIDNTFRGSEFATEQSIRNYIPFTEQSSIILQGVIYSSAAWGDYDNDNDLDLLITGMNQTEQGISKIYRNQGNNNFVEQTSVSLIGVYLGSTTWGDYDNDGYLDILLTGYTSPTTSVSKIYRNNGNNSFSELASSPLIGVGYSASAWGDFNNDGYLDIIITGRNGDTWLSKIYENNGNGTFTDQTTINLLGVGAGSVAWGDYDNDGKLDILLTGTSGNLNSVSKIYRNMGDGTFIELSSLSLPGVFYSSVSWGDFDSDGDLDIALAGLNVNSPITKIYRNEGSNNFEELNISELIPVQAGSIVFGDYDNDGFLDLLISGQTQENLTITKIYKNKGGNFFIEDTSISIIGVRNSTCNWIDYDNDGDLDIFISGFTGKSRVSKIFKNNFHIPNNLPSSPIELITEINGNSVTFNWNLSSDNETPSKGLKYNLVLGTTPMANNCISPMSNRQNGFRKIIGLGNANHNTTWTIKNLPKGSYYWAVQSIDNSFAGSPFSEEKTFNVGGTKFVIEGLYNEVTNKLRMKDTVKAYLRNVGPPCAIVDSAVAVLDSVTFIADFNFLSAESGTYYLALKYRNGLETWSREGGISFSPGAPLSYDFTSDSSKAYGNNLVKKGNLWCVFSGDVNQDGYINIKDVSAISKAIRANISGYVDTDLNGDLIVDERDLHIAVNNSNSFVGCVTPLRGKENE